MDIDYQQKYAHLQSVCKKQQKTIAKLQLQIRQRCQSYLLHSSKHKITQSNEQKINPDSNYSSSPAFKINNFEDSVVETVEWSSKIEDQPNLMKSAFSCDSSITKRTTQNFTITNQINISQTPDIKKQFEKAEQKVNYEQIINSFKDRIVRIQQQKNKTVKEMQRIQQQLTISNKRNSDLERKMEVSEKEFRKTKSKIEQANQVQSVTLQIYQQLSQKANMTTGEQQLEDFKCNKLKQKLNLILQQTKSININQTTQKPIEEVKRVQLSIEKVSQITYEPCIQKTIQPQHQIERVILQDKITQASTDQIQQESQCQIFEPDSQLEKVIDITIQPTTQIKQAELQRAIQELTCLHKQQIARMLEQKRILQQKQVELTTIKTQLKNQLQKQTQNRLQDQNVLQQLKKQLQHQKQKLLKSKQQEDQLQQQNLTLITENMEKQNKMSNLSLQIERLKRQTEQLTLQNSKLKQEIQNLKIIESNYESTKNQLDKSRSIIDELESSKIAKQLKEMKSSLTASRKLQGNDSLNSSGFKVVQKLEEPYYVQEQLQNDMNHEYVKRSFIRKKIVRRNLSATAYRVVSKSREQVDELIRSKVSQYTDKSLQKSKKVQQSAKKQQLKSSLKDQRISELSEQNRDSSYFNNVQQVVKIIEVTTKTPREQVTTTKISSQNQVQNKSFRRRHES